MHLVPDHQASLEVVILVGLQAAGKSTFCRRYFASTHVVISKDQFRNNRRPQRRQMQLLTDALEAHHSVVIDNTNPQPEDRAEVIAIAKQCGAFVCGYFFECALEVALARNANRTGKQRVPRVGITATARRLRRPARNQGFDAVYCVTTAGDGEFEITPLRELGAVADARLHPR